MTPSDECYEVKAGVVCLQVKLCDPHPSALEVIQIYVYVYLYLYTTCIAFVVACVICTAVAKRSERTFNQ